jgi:preprotein translocase subunit YajC
VFELTGLLGATSTSSGSSPLTLMLPILLIGGMYLLLIRPQQRQRKQQQMLAQSVDPGDEIVTFSGIYGTILEIDDDEGTVVVEVAPDVEIKMVKTAIARRLVFDDEDGHADDGADDAHNPDGAHEDAHAERADREASADEVFHTGSRHDSDSGSDRPAAEKEADEKR